MTGHESVVRSFSGVAANYATSTGHAHAGVLERFVALLRPIGNERALDIATGAGHVALTLAPQVAEVTAYDLTTAMLEVTADAAEARGIANLTTRQGPAERLPFPDGAFDLVTSRLGAHHFTDLDSALQEMRRVIASGGRIAIEDTVSPDDGASDLALDRIERLRDPSHVRNYTLTEWRTKLAAAGFRIESETTGYFGDGTEMNIEGWMERIGTPIENRALVRHAFDEAPEGLKTILRYDGQAFQIPVVTLLARPQ
ncbi:methyltransferase domain-containing protein [bacterium]|nr:MAG: methyltransferase domain-containing protein [bacterium]